MFTKKDFFWMRHCLFLADRSQNINEVPVGAVIILNNNLLAEGWNQSISRCDVTSHAEIIAIRTANFLLNNYRLNNCSMYVTLEPCIMCLGAILNSRISNLYYGAKNFFSIKNFLKKYHYNINIYSSLLKNKCSQKIKKFFLNIRK